MIAQASGEAGGNQNRRLPLVRDGEAAREELGQPFVVPPQVDAGDLVSLSHLLPETDLRFYRDPEVDRVLGPGPPAAGLHEQETELAQVQGGELAGRLGDEGLLQLFIF
jgi:hypothetical protein